MITIIYSSYQPDSMQTIIHRYSPNLRWSIGGVLETENILHAQSDDKFYD